MTTIWITLALTIGFTGFAFAQGTRKFPEVKISTIINAPTDTAFNYIIPVDLSHIFKRYKRFPAILKTNETEKWNKAGLSRTVFFEDGTTAQETMLSVISNKSFAYKIENFTSPLRKLAKRVDGKYVFNDLGNGQTEIAWTYKIIPKNFIASGILKIAVLKDLRVLLTSSLQILKDDLEKESQHKISINSGDRVITITRVNTPAFASPILLRTGFKKAIPDFKNKRGLVFKYFQYETKPNRVFGGIYLWNDKLYADSCFNENWHAKIKRKYKANGTVDYYSVISIETFDKDFKYSETHKKSVSLLVPILPNEKYLLQGQTGLLRSYRISQQTHQHYILLFTSKNMAENFLNKNQINQFELFHTPVFVNNQ